MFSGLSGLMRRPSMESFVSPNAEASESFSSQPGTMRRLRSMSQLRSRPSLPHISPLVAKRTTPVHVRHKLAWWVWSRQYLRLTNYTVSLHRYPDMVELEIIVLCKVRHVGRVDKQPRCLRVETIEDKIYYFSFDQEDELYIWLTEIHLATSPVGKPKDVERLVHVVPDEDDKGRLIGLPEDWQFFNPSSDRGSITKEMIETALPEMSFSSHEDVIDLMDSLPYSRPVSPDSDFESDVDQAVILKAQIAIRPVTQRLLDIQPGAQPLKIITEDFSSRPPLPSQLLSALEDSPSTPLLTPDTTPLTPFRESPYRYRESDAQDLSGQIHKQSNWPDAQGGFADIWRAKWRIQMGVDLPVAVKVLRVLSQDEHIKDKIQRRLRKEVRVWHQLRHKNIVPMYGTCEGFGPFPSMVSSWCENGNIVDYLHREGDRGTVGRRLKLLTEVARGLNYLHTFAFPVHDGAITKANIVHGDLKGANILVNNRGEAALADFGLSSIIAVAGDPTSTTFSGGSVRWMAPELLLSANDTTMLKTCASDTYSYGSVILEVLTGERPYSNISTDPQVITLLMEGHRPKRPMKPIINPDIWALMERCWGTRASDRPQMSFVLSRMENFYREHKKTVSSEA